MAGVEPREPQSRGGWGEAEPLWTIVEAAAYLNVKPTAIYELTRRGALYRLPSLRLGRELRFRPETVRRYVRERERGGEEERQRWPKR